jgi:DNA-binding transcriptional ArsR family regulator
MNIPSLRKKTRKAGPSAISHHMAILTKAGLVDAEKLDLWRWYRRNESSLRELMKGLKEQI